MIWLVLICTALLAALICLYAQYRATVADLELVRAALRRAEDRAAELRRLAELSDAEAARRVIEASRR